MTWPIPAPGDIAERYAVGFERAFAIDDDGVPYPQSPDVRSPNSAFRALGVVGEETWTELYLYQGSLAQELMPDTAQDWLPRHAAEWGTPRLQPLTALGNLVFTGPPDLPLPAGIEVFGPTGLRWITRSAATIPAGGSISIPSEAEAAGTASNLAGGVVMPLVSPVGGLAPQSASTDADGFQGGTDIEPVEAWRGRILRRIRDRGRAGDLTDYEDWATEAGAASSRVLFQWVGPGSVGVAVVMAGPRAPLSAEVTRIAAHIDALRPVTAEVIVLGATLLPVPVQLAISPDTVAVRSAVSIALAAFFQRDAAIGAVLPVARLVAAVQSASGEYDCAVALPAGDVVPGATQIPVLGAVTFTSGATLPQPPA